jgi:hypothetical protein
MAVRVSLPDRVKCVLVDDEIEVGLAVSVPGRDDAAGALIVSCMQSEEQRCNACLEARSARVVRDRREPAHRQNDGLPYRIDWRVQRHRVVRGFWIDGAGGCTPPPATGRRAAAGLYALRPFYFVRPDRAWARARQSFPCSATAMLILRRGGGRSPAIAASPMCLWASARKRRSLRILRNRTTPSPRRSVLARRRFAVSENQLWRSDANPTFARGPETIPMASVHYVCARSGNRMGSSTSTAAPRAKSGEPPSSKTRLSAFGHQASGWKPNSSVRTGCSQTWGKASVNLKGRVASRSSISSRSPSCLTITTAPNGSSLKAIRD